MGLVHRGGWLWSLVLGFAVAQGCGGNPEVNGNEPDDSGGSSGSGGSSASGATGGTGGTVLVPPEGGDGAGDQTGAGGQPSLPCADAPCSSGQRCEVNGDTSECVNNVCDDLTCEDEEECQPAPGGGFACVSIACDGDVDCPQNRYCDGKKCVNDACEANTRTCDGRKVISCAANGSEETSPYTCGSAGYYTSACNASAPGGVGCTCEDDWDCPEFTACESGVCTGTGVAPTCSLPVKPFADVLPTLEFHWGGTDSAHKEATGSPFPWSAQAGTTPIVINLDDDNGDGVANELDFPEIVFMTYYGDNPQKFGVVRAVHGGGPNKGKDMFALCGSQHWFEGDPQALDCNPATAGTDDRALALGRASGGLAAGDLDGDGFPEIVVPLSTGALQILDHEGQIITTSAANLWVGLIPYSPATALTLDDFRYPAPAIANLDFDGLPEIIMGPIVMTLKQTAGALEFDRKWVGTGTMGTANDGNDNFHFGPMVCPADLTPNPGMEIVAGTTLYRLPDEQDCAASPTSDYCTGKLTTVWNASTVAGNTIAYPEGFCAVADVLGEDTVAAPGPDNPLDGKPEVLVLSDGHLLILEAATGTLLRNVDLGGGRAGGAPNVDDFDGDGFPEIGTALERFYTVIDLQAPSAVCAAWTVSMNENGAAPPDGNPPRTPGGACTRDDQCGEGAICHDGGCLCLHNGWRRASDDSSSRVTSSSVFDFNGDGAAEVVYNDQCYFRVYDGRTGQVYLALPSLSRTIIENPVVADVDNDGNAEIVFLNNSDPLRCHSGMATEVLDQWPPGSGTVPITSLPNGIDVWGDQSDQWVAARRIWNQHAYHVTNVTESGALPLHEPESWMPLNGRLYNTYRSQPRNYNVAPDLALTAIQVSSPDQACGKLSDRLQITVEVRNLGDLRVGPGVEIEFFGAWSQPNLSAALEDDTGRPLVVTLEKSLEPGATTLVTVTYEAGANGREELPGEVRAVIDGKNTQQECKEDNNEIAAPVEAGAELADIGLEIDAARDCQKPKISFTVTNEGSAPASDILVRIFAGDPSAGGTLIGETTVAGPLAPGASEAVAYQLPKALSRDVRIWAVADPLDTISECNDANNVARGPLLDCAPVN